MRLPAIEKQSLAELYMQYDPTTVHQGSKAKPQNSSVTFKHVHSDLTPVNNKPIKATNGQFSINSQFIEARIKALSDHVERNPEDKTPKIVTIREDGTIITRPYLR